MKTGMMTLLFYKSLLHPVGQGKNYHSIFICDSISGYHVWWGELAFKMKKNRNSSYSCYRVWLESNVDLFSSYSTRPMGFCAIHAINWKSFTQLLLPTISDDPFSSTPLSLEVSCSNASQFHSIFGACLFLVSIVHIFHWRLWMWTRVKSWMSQHFCSSKRSWSNAHPN